MADFLVSNGNTNENHKPLIFSLVLLSIEQHLKTITLLQQPKSLERRDLAATAAQRLYESRLTACFMAEATQQVKLFTAELLLRAQSSRNSQVFAKLIFSN